MLNGFRAVYFNSTNIDTATVPTLGVSSNPGDNMFCQQSPFLTPAGIHYMVTTLNSNFVDFTTHQVSVALNSTNFGNTSSPVAATWFEFYVDANSTLRMNPITQFNLVNCGTGSGQQSTSDAVMTTKSTAAYVLSLVIAITSAVLMIAL